jgi:hypothetical protein
MGEAVFDQAGRDVDDPAPVVFAHVGDDGAGEQVGTDQVGVHR